MMWRLSGCAGWRHSTAPKREEGRSTVGRRSEAPTSGLARSRSSFSVRTDAVVGQVGPGPRRDRLGHVEVAGVEVLLDDDEQFGVEVAQRRYDRPEVGHAPGWLAARSPGDRLAEGEILTFGHLDHCGIHLFDVDISDALRIGAHDVDDIRVAVRQVPGVEAQRDV